MKKTLVLLSALCSMTFANAQNAAPASSTTAAQPQKPNGPKPEMVAQRHSKHLEKALGLTPEQTQKAYDALLIRFTEIQKIRQKYGPEGDKKARHAEVVAVRKNFVQTMNGILTPEQKVKWDEHRKAVKKGKTEHKNANGNPPPASGSNDIKKLTDDDDGIIDE